MCRIFACISEENCSPRSFLVSDRCSLLNQSTARPDKLQKDGWGIVWYGPQLEIFKSPNPVFEEKDAFISKSTRQHPITIAHIRKASNPMGLPQEKLRSYENTQPFVFENWSFAHNGQINHPDRVRESMGVWGEKVRGINDSEVYFWLLMKYIEEKRDVKEAIKAVIEHLYDVWNKIPENERAGAPYSALNMVLSDGVRIYAFCKYDGKGKDSLCYKDRPYYQMQYLKRKGILAIASERTSEDDWVPLEDGSLLTAGRDGSFRIENL